MNEQWDEWARPLPLAPAPLPVTRETCEIRPCLVRDAGRWEATPVRFRTDARRSTWETSCRLTAWARPKGATGWPFLLLTWLTTCWPDPRRTHSPRPRWRSAWVRFDSDLVEPYAAPERGITSFWRDQLSKALGEAAAELGIEEPPPARR
jgi:hypothetical protein